MDEPRNSCALYFTALYLQANFLAISPICIPAVIQTINSCLENGETVAAFLLPRFAARKMILWSSGIKYLPDRFCAIKARDSSECLLFLNGLTRPLLV